MNGHDSDPIGDRPPQRSGEWRPLRDSDGEIVEIVSLCYPELVIRRGRAWITLLMTEFPPSELPPDAESAPGVRVPNRGAPGGRNTAAAVAEPHPRDLPVERPYGVPWNFTS